MSRPLIAEYVWIDARNGLRSKCRTIYLDTEGSPNTPSVYQGCKETPTDLTVFPMWNFDGSSTDQNNYTLSTDSLNSGPDMKNTEVILNPVKYYSDPWIENKWLVLCECLDPELKPIKSNNRAEAADLFKYYKDQKPWFGLEQEYVLCVLTSDMKQEIPVGWEYTRGSLQGDYYCGVGSRNSFSRGIVEEHYSLCLKMGLKISGTNAEVMPGQWEFQVGPSEGIDAADELIMARYILEKLCEKYNVWVSYNPKISQDYNGSGCHINFSTEDMRGENGMKYIKKAIVNMNRMHSKTLKSYGSNDNRLTGKQETSSRTEFSWGIGTRDTSVRIPNQVNRDNKGYLEDRRPASDIDPYLATTALVDAALNYT